MKWQRQRSPNQRNQLSRWLNRWMTEVREASGRQDPLKNPDTFVFYYVGGLLFMTAYADWSKEIWESIYYVWQRGKDTLAIAFMILVSREKYKKVLRPTLAVSLTLLAWEIIASASNADVNSLMIVDYIFLMCLAIVIYQYYLRWRERRSL